jgi:phage baseplate assembly protein W
MRGLKLVDGDLIFDSNRELSMIEGLDEIAQSLFIIVQTRLGEFYLDETVGTDHSALLAKQFDEDAAHDAIVEALMEDNRVEEVTDIQFTQTGRTLGVSFSVQTTTGDPVTVNNVSIDGGDDSA